ncbi:MAG: cyclic nucleotide-binding domain-containing protein [Anaerolineae bacterium]|nr:cyclic nucleotide-binding domain-containing protein [Anaerolineae bacterium]
MVSPEAKVALLEHTFAGMNSETLAQLTQVARVATYHPGHILCRENEHEDTFYIILDGEVAITKTMGDSEHLLRRGKPGEFFGEMALLDESIGRSASVSTTKTTTVIEIDRQDFNQLVARYPSIVMSMARIIIQRMRENDRLAITELQAQKQELQEAYDSLSKLHEQRNLFLTTLAHELRTPLTGVMGYMQLVRSGLMNGPGLQMSLEKIGAGLDRMVSLINDLLFLQQMEGLEARLRRVDLNSILMEVIDKARPYAQEQKVTFNLALAESLQEIMGDADGLSRAFGHVLDNAIKFSPRGGDVNIGTAQVDDYLNVTIEDHGVGISPEFMPRLFKLFERDEKYNEFLFGGVGLGLPIVKNIMTTTRGLSELTPSAARAQTF